ncbi:trypsin-like serine peptidase [Chloroflexus sp.]|uniref:trypsin-like serine peptidase n=1 Tax=Chloroflexus sp. TaxID=1904827 RepID=UPI00298F2227|nr:trypsin-like serine protease [Chloroflexus sp.]MCX7860127.1 trypsin-like serine protease [Chloroflexus sp.]MDW8405174.1 trypsin-like serine protease [Chloroflexus sp.]
MALKAYVLLVTLLLSVLGVGSLALSPATHATSGSRCLSDDPFELDELVRVMSAETPPTAPVIINSFIRVRFIGKGALRDPPSEPRDLEPPFAPPTPPGPPNPNERDEQTIPAVDGRIRVFNSRTTNEFEIEVAAAVLEAIHDCRTRARLHLGTLGVDDPVGTEQGYRIHVPIILHTRPAQLAVIGESPAPMARSDGEDSRIILTPATKWPWRAIAQFSNGCTGTLVGPRHMITAAHCINQFGTTNWNSFTIWPGREGNTFPFGSSTIPGQPGQTAWYFTHPQWRNSNTDNPGQWDWGFIVIPDRLGDTTGWMGYCAYTATNMRQAEHLNRGYPICSTTRPDRPVDCQIGRLYGDTNSCDLGNFSFMGSDNWYRLVSHNCDTSAGHSGSPFYRWVFDPDLNQQVPCVVGVHFGSLCDRDVDNDGTIEESENCDADDDYPSIVRRNTPTELDMISFFRELFP